VSANHLESGKAVAHQAAKTHDHLSFGKLANDGVDHV
jgi:hypothetical protein